MVTLFFLLGLLCGIVIAAFSVKLFLDTKKGAAFMGITLASPKPAIVGIVIGVVMLLSALIAYLPLSSEVSDLSGRLKHSEGTLSSTQKRLEDAHTDIAALTTERGSLKSQVTEAQDKIKELKKDLEAKAETTVEKTGESKKLKETITSIKKQLADSTKEARDLLDAQVADKAKIETLGHEIQQLKEELETEKEFRRDFVTFVQQQEAVESSFRGTALKLYQKLRELYNKYKK
jgi:chromosome segregation ATPase